MLLSRLRLLITSLWVGSLWAIGYIAAPTLFAMLADRALAGTIAGSLFRIEAWISIVCGASVLLMLSREKPAERRLPMLLASAMLGCTLVGHFGLQPLMAELRANAGGMMDQASRARFGMLHGVAAAIYLLQSLLGLALVWKQR